MRKNNKMAVKDIIKRQCIHINQYLDKIDNCCLRHLNSINWKIKDKDDVNYYVYDAHHQVDFFSRRTAWLIDNINDDDTTGCRAQKIFLDIMNDLRQSVAYPKSSVCRVLENNDKYISLGEQLLFRRWLAKQQEKLCNYLLNKHSRYQEESIYAEKAIKKLSDELNWAIKSKPNHIPDKLALSSVFMYRYANTSFFKDGMEYFNRYNQIRYNYSINELAKKMVEWEIQNNFKIKN